MNISSCIILCILGLALPFAIAAYDNFGDFSRFLENIDVSQTPERNEHLVGELPYAEGEEPLRESYAGYIDVRTFKSCYKKGDAAIFYWFFPAQEPLREDPPLAIWMQGGPGSSSMIGLFYEMGPLRVTPNMTLLRNPHTWNKRYSMLFIDQPVGTGWSYVETTGDDKECGNAVPPDVDWTKKVPSNQLVMGFFRKQYERVTKKYGPEPEFASGYVTNQKGVVKDLLVFLQKFYQMYPEQRKRDLYINGESYAGKYVPSFAYAIHQHNKHAVKHNPDAVFPLVGISVGSGLTDPKTQIKIHGSQAYQFGLIGRADARIINAYADRAIHYIERGDYDRANDMRLMLFEYYKNVTGSINYYDIRKLDIQNDWSVMETFMNLRDTQKALNVGKHEFFKDQTVIESLHGDIMRSSAPLFKTLIENYKVLLYQGNMDFRDGYSGNTEWLYSLDFKGAKGFRQAPRKVWRVNGHTVGFTVQHQSLARVTILDAGHLVPMDQPVASLEMMTYFIENVKF